MQNIKTPGRALEREPERLPSAGLEGVPADLIQGIDQRMKVLEVVLPGAGVGWAWGVPAGGATVFGANGGGLVTGAGGNTPEGITLLVAGGEQGMVGAGMMLETEGISVLAGEKDSVMQAPTGVEHAGGA